MAGEKRSRPEERPSTRLEDHAEEYGLHLMKWEPRMGLRVRYALKKDPSGDMKNMYYASELKREARDEAAVESIGQ